MLGRFPDHIKEQTECGAEPAIGLKRAPDCVRQNLMSSRRYGHAVDDFTFPGEMK